MEYEVPAWIRFFAVIGIGASVVFVLSAITWVAAEYRRRVFLGQLDKLNTLCDEALEYLPELRKVHGQIVALQAQAGYDPENPTEGEKVLSSRRDELGNLISNIVGQMKNVMK